MMRRFTYFPLILLALTLAILYFPLLRGEAFYWGLPTLQFYPWRSLAYDLLRDGILPLWNPYNGAGAPLLANYQSALLYPPSWISLLLPRTALEWSMSLTAVIHLWIAGWGMWRLTGRLGVSDLGRGVSLFAFALTNYLVARLFTFPIITAAAWLPWIAWAALGVLITGRRREVAWLALFTALILLAGHAQTAWYSLTLVGLMSLWWVVADPTPEFGGEGGLSRISRLLAVIAGMALGAGVAAIQLAPTAELLSQSQRSGGVDFDFAMNFSYAPARALNIFSPTIFGTPADGSYFTQGVYFEDAVYVGVIPLIGAVVAVIAWLRRRKAPESVYRSVPFWLMVVVIGFVFALGVHTAVFPFLYRNIPTFDLFQAPVRWHMWTVFGGSVLAGIGVSAWGRGRVTRRWSRRVLVGAISAASLLIVIQPFMGIGNAPLGILVRGLISFPVVVGAAALLTLVQPNRESPRYGRWMIAVLLVVAVDLAFASRGLNPTYMPNAAPDSALQSAPEGGRAYLRKADVDAAMFLQVFRLNDYRASSTAAVFGSGLPNTNINYRAPLLNNFDPLLPASFARTVELIEAYPAHTGLLRAAGVDGAHRDAARAWFVDSVCWHETQADLEAALIDPAWNPYGQAHIAGDAGCADVSELSEDAPITVTDRVNTVTITVDAPHAGWLILADTDYPGWHARVDGAAAPIYRANLMFRAVQIDTGLHEVEFSYQPEWIAPALLISVVSLILLVFLFRLRA